MVSLSFAKIQCVTGHGHHEFCGKRTYVLLVWGSGIGLFLATFLLQHFHEPSHCSGAPHAPPLDKKSPTSLGARMDELLLL